MEKSLLGISFILVAVGLFSLPDFGPDIFVTGLIFMLIGLVISISAASSAAGTKGKTELYKQVFDKDDDNVVSAEKNEAEGEDSGK